MEFLEEDGWVTRYTGTRYNLKLKLIECSKCKKVKGFRSFTKSNRSITGREGVCKICKRKHKPTIIDGIKYNVTVIGVKYNKRRKVKECTRCKEIKSFEDFTITETGLFQRDSSCKVCNAKRSSIYSKSSTKTIKNIKVRSKKYRSSSKAIKNLKNYKEENKVKIQEREHTRSVYGVKTLTDSYVSGVIASRFRTLGVSREKFHSLIVPESFSTLVSLVLIVQRIIKIKSDKEMNEVKKTKAIVEVVKQAFKPINYSQFHNTKEVNDLLIDAMKRLSEPEPTITIAAATAIIKAANVVVNNTALELKKQQVSTLITHIGVSNKMIDA